jgi:hypothetical protein
MICPIVPPPPVLENVPLRVAEDAVPRFAADVVAPLLPYNIPPAKAMITTIPQTM